jgi:hypothetical protein
MNKLMIIPKQIHVGYVNRNDTYTGKLAYVIYTDAKGVKRKQVSWDGWRDDKLTPLDTDNVPTSGFVLNKNGGGGRGGWNSRNEFIRVYDPRGFEFEISLANLLYILQETTSTKGKGLEGEFVYAWDGTSLVLLPVGTPEYVKSTEHSQLQSKKLTAKDMEVGHEYTTKNGNKLVYMGRGNFVDGGGYYFSVDKVVKDHIYALVTNGTYRFIRKGGFTHLGAKVSDSEYGDWVNVLKEFNKTRHHLDVKGLSFKPNQVIDGNHLAYRPLGDGKYGIYDISQKSNGRWGESHKETDYIYKYGEATFVDNKLIIDRLGNSNWWSGRDVHPLMVEDITPTSVTGEKWSKVKHFTYPEGYGALYLEFSDGKTLKI